MASLSIGTLIVLSAFQLAGQSGMMSRQQEINSYVGLGMGTLAETLEIDDGSSGTNLTSGDHGPLSINESSHSMPVQVSWTVTPDNPIPNILRIDLAGNQSTSGTKKMTFFRRAPLGASTYTSPTHVALPIPIYVAPTLSYYWKSGAWGPYTSGTCTRPVECWSTPVANLVADSYCAAYPKPATTMTCPQYVWQSPGWGACTQQPDTTWIQTRAGSVCIDEAIPATTLDTNCPTPAPATTQTCVPPVSFR